MSARSSNSFDLLSHLKGNAKQILGPGFWELRLATRVEAGWKQDRLDSRVLAISKFRVFIVSGKGAGKTGIETWVHVLGLRSLETLSATDLRVGLEDGRRLYLRSPEAAIVTAALLAALRHYFPSSAGFLPALLASPSAALCQQWAAVGPNRPALPCADFRRTYAALCDYYRLAFRDEVGWDIDKIYASHGIRTLRLDDFSHLYPKDLVPILAVLQFNSWFTGLAVDGAKLSSEQVEVLEAVVRRSIWLKTLVLRSAGLKSEALGRLGAAMASNEGLSLEEIDLSGNALDDAKAASAFAAGLASGAARLRTLRLADAGLGPKGLNPLAAALFRNQASLPTLTAISLRGNPLHDGSELFNLLAHCVNLRELDLSQTGLALEKLWLPLKSGGLQLERLCLAGCTLASAKKSHRDTPPPALKEFFASAVYLSHLDLSEAVFGPDVLKALLLGLASNTQISGLQLDLSRALSDKACVPVLETALGNVAELRSLVLRDCALEADLGSVVCAARTLYKLDIGGANLNSLRKHQPKLLPGILMELVHVLNDEERPLRELCISDAKLGVHVSVLLNALGPSPNLRVLDVSGNEMGNYGARLLAKAMQVNASLERVLIDRNRVGSEGFSDLAQALEQNAQVCDVPYPVSDVAEALGKGAERTALLASLSKVQEKTRKNLELRTLGRAEPDPRLALCGLLEEVTRAAHTNSRHGNLDPVQAEEVDFLRQTVENFETLIYDAAPAEKIVAEAIAKLEALHDSQQEELERRLGLPESPKRAAPLGRLRGAEAGLLERWGSLGRRGARALLEARLLRTLSALKAEAGPMSPGAALEASFSAESGWADASTPPPSTPSALPFVKSPRGSRRTPTAWPPKAARPKSIVEGGALESALSLETSQSSSNDLSPLPTPLADAPNLMTDGDAKGREWREALKSRPKPARGRRGIKPIPSSPLTTPRNQTLSPIGATNGVSKIEEEAVAEGNGIPVSLESEEVKARQESGGGARKALVPPALPAKPPKPPPTHPPPKPPTQNSGGKARAVSWARDPDTTEPSSPEEETPPVPIVLRRPTKDPESSGGEEGGEGRGGDRRSVVDLLSVFEGRGQKVAPTDS